MTDRLGSLLGTEGLCDHWRPVRRDPAIQLTLLFPLPLYVAWFRIKEPRKEPEPSLGAGVNLKEANQRAAGTRRNQAGLFKILGQT